MIKRSELKESMYVRMSDVLDNGSFWSRLMKGRYFQIDTPATEPDDATCYGPCYGSIIMYGMNYVKQAFNSDMEPITPEEQGKLSYVFKNQNEFKGLFKLGEKIYRHIGNIEDLLNEVGVYGLNLWEISDTKNFIEQLKEEICLNDSNANLSEYEDELEELEEMFNRLISMLDNLSALEDKYIRRVK